MSTESADSSPDAPADVLIAGAGPTGLLMAAELVRHGARVRIVERRSAPSVHSKALGLHARTLELFENIGVIDEFLDIGHRVFGVNVFASGKRLAHLSMDELDSPYPFILALPQNDTENLLEQHLASLGVNVERGVELEQLEQDAEGVEATLVDSQGKHRVRVGWLVGCDGAHSTVRKQLGLKFAGTDIDAPFVFIDGHVDWSHPDDEVYAFWAPDGVLGMIPLPRLGPGYWRAVAGVAPSGQPEELSVEYFQNILDRRTGLRTRLSDPRWMTSFTVRQRKVERFASGRVFVAGDAAHAHSPIGGQGMNIGLQDAYNLAWKLALVVKGTGRAELLDSYQAEREPVAKALLQGTEWVTRVVTLRHPMAQALRNQMARLITSFDVVQQRLASAVGEIDFGYRNSPMVAEDRQSLLRATVLRDDRVETPSIAQWRDFGAGPRAGDRAPDVELCGDSGPDRLFQVLRDARHHLLLFDGAASTGEGYENLAYIAGVIDDRHGEHVAVHVVVPCHEKPENLAWQGSVISDGEGAVHERYGASAECLYLIRPDGYIGYRAQPADCDLLLAYLGKLFK